jgi:hypothetical protein
MDAVIEASVSGTRSSLVQELLIHAGDELVPLLF